MFWRRAILLAFAVTELDSVRHLGTPRVPGTRLLALEQMKSAGQFRERMSLSPPQAATRVGLCAVDVRRRRSRRTSQTPLGSKILRCLRTHRPATQPRTLLQPPLHPSLRVACPHSYSFPELVAHFSLSLSGSGRLMCVLLVPREAV